MRHLLVIFLSSLFLTGCVIETTDNHHSHHSGYYKNDTVYYPGAVRIYFIDTHPNRFCPPGHAYHGYCYLDKPDYDRAVKDPKWEKEMHHKAHQEQKAHENKMKDNDRESNQEHKHQQKNHDKGNDQPKQNNKQNNDHNHGQPMEKEKSSSEEKKEDKSEDKKPSKGKKDKD